MRPLPLLFQIALTFGSPISDCSDRDILYGEEHLRNGCDPGGMPSVYIEYRADRCPPAYSMDESGNCPNDEGHYAGLGSGTGLCAPRYCEVRQTFKYHREIPFSNTDCRWPLTCTFGVIQGGTFQLSPQVDRKWNGALDQGVTGGYSYAKTKYTSGLIRTVTPDEGECMYMTYLPIVRESCGTMSQGRWEKQGFWSGRVECSDYQNIGNMCTLQPYRSSDGTQSLGDIVLVKYNCSNERRLPMDQQDPAYRHDGVALPQGAFSAFLHGRHPTLSGDVSLVTVHKEESTLLEDQSTSSATEKEHSAAWPTEEDQTRLVTSNQL